MPSTWAAVALVVFAAAVLALVDWTPYGHAEDQVRLQGYALAQDYALRIGGRLRNQLAELEFIAGMVVADQAQLSDTTARRAEQVLEHLAARHSGVESVRWSTSAPSPRALRLSMTICVPWRHLAIRR